MASDPPPELLLTPINGKPRSVRELLLMFHLVFVALDPFTNESAWILPTAARILTVFDQADCRVAWLVAGATPEECRLFLGPWADQILTFADPDREAVKAFGGAAGNFELNVMLPVIARNLLESIRLLASVSRALADKCVAGIVADQERCRTYALSSPAVVTALNPYIGYEAAARVMKRATAEGKDLRSVVLEEGLLSEDEVDRALDVMAMTKGGILK